MDTFVKEHHSSMLTECQCSIKFAVQCSPMMACSKKIFNGEIVVI